MTETMRFGDPKHADWWNTRFQQVKWLGGQHLEIEAGMEVMWTLQVAFGVAREEVSPFWAQTCRSRDGCIFVGTVMLLRHGEGCPYRSSVLLAGMLTMILGVAKDRRALESTCRPHQARVSGRLVMFYWQRLKEEKMESEEGTVLMKTWTATERLIMLW